MSKKAAKSNAVIDYKILNNIVKRAVYYSTQMIHIANNRDDIEKGDPKVGGHPAACSSSAHILGTLHLLSKGPFDHMAVKPHASPMDHSFGHLLKMFLHRDGRPFSEDEAKKVMTRLRYFMNPEDPNSEPAFQSYHAAVDPDAFNFMPTGTVGIPPVVSTFTALAYKFAKDHGFDVPEKPHFWSLIGDSEFREGSLAECMPDTAERELGNVTWIVDYNRQNLDGTRIKNEEGIHGTDAQRIERLAIANGWKVFQVRHGKKRLEMFKQNPKLQKLVESLSDFEVQALLQKGDGLSFKKRVLELDSSLKSLISKYTDKQLEEAFEDFGGHDVEVLSEVFEECKKSNQPTLVIAHTIKGWGIPSLKAKPGNHSMLPEQEEVDALRKEQGIPDSDLFAYYDPSTKEAKYLEKRSKELIEGRDFQFKLKNKNLEKIAKQIEEAGGFPTSFGINLKLSPWANTQWMWGQLAAKLIRIANSPEGLTDDEKKWALAAKYLVTMAPDVGTSTNLNPSMDGKVYAPDIPEDFEAKYQVKDKRRPDLVPLEKQSNRHLRFEIEEGNAMSCVGAFGKMGDHVGVRILPMMTVYDFFIKRALDQYFYNVYWKSSFILVGTPSGVTLSPEGAQHSWKSDIQIPNSITWEPAFSIELDWILSDCIRRHFTADNHERESVLIRAVTRGIEQKLMIENLRAQKRFEGMDDQSILDTTRIDVLNGGYWLINYTGYEGYIPGDNVVHIFVMGALVSEAVEASKKLLEQGIYANVCVVTSNDLIAGTLARQNNYQHLRETLGVNGDLFLNSTQSSPVGRLNVSGSQLALSSTSDLLSMRGARVPIVGVCDGEPGLIDNIGSIIGVPQDTLAVRKHSKSGTPKDVYQYHHLDPQSIADSAIRMLEISASEEIIVSRVVAENYESTQSAEQPQFEQAMINANNDDSNRH